MVRKILGVLWLPLMVFIGEIIFLFKYNPEYLEDPTHYLTMALLSALPSLILWASSLGKPSAKKSISGKEKAKYPPIPKEIQHKDPTGTIVFGKDKHTGCYVGKRIIEPGHIFIIGGSGSGKSSCLIIPTILANRKCRIIAIDIKGELHEKGEYLGHENIHVIDPQDRNSVGYDPLYLLNEDSSSQDVLETMQLIATSLIPIPPDIKDPFWKNSARNLLIGFMVYFYKKGIKDFIGVCDKILGSPSKEIIGEILDSAKPTSVEYKYVVQFKDMADETLGGIVSEMNNHLVLFATDQDIRYAIQTNPSKVNPSMIEDEDCKIYISIREEKLTAYYDLLQLIINQALSYMETRPETSEPILFIIDELPRLVSAGKIEKLMDGARTLRSRNVTLILVSQSTEALMSAYSEHEVMDLISNCPYIACLSAATSRTQNAIVDWVGIYTARKTSWSGEGKGMKANISYDDEKKILDKSELMTLKEDAILISPYGYSRLKKTKYYEDKFFMPIAEEIEKHNKGISE